MCCWVFGDLCNCEYSEPALSPCAMLLQQEGEQHEETPVVDDPPDVNVALIIVIVITWWRKLSIKLSNGQMVMITMITEDVEVTPSARQPHCSVPGSGLYCGIDTSLCQITFVLFLFSWSIKFWSECHPRNPVYLFKIWQTQPWTSTDIPIIVFAPQQSYWCSNIALGKDQMKMASYCKFVKSEADASSGWCNGEQSERGVGGVPNFVGIPPTRYSLCLEQSSTD